MNVVCAAAAAAGNVALLQWLREGGCPWDEYACTCAAQMGHLSALQWLRSHVCMYVIRLLRFSTDLHQDCNHMCSI